MIAEKSSYTYAEMREVLDKWAEVKGIRFTAVDGRQLINMIRELNRMESEQPEQAEQPKRTRRTKN